MEVSGIPAIVVEGLVKHYQDGDETVEAVRGSISRFGPERSSASSGRTGQVSRPPCGC